jgi:hypothetical protein
MRRVSPVGVGLNPEAMIFAGVVMAVALWPALRAALRRQLLLAAAYALGSLLVVFVLPMNAQNSWQAANPDRAWSLSAPVWLLLLTSPLVTLPSVLFSTLVINLFVRPVAHRRRYRGGRLAAPRD